MFSGLMSLRKCIGWVFWGKVCKGQMMHLSATALPVNEAAAVQVVQGHGELLLGEWEWEWEWGK